MCGGAVVFIKMRCLLTKALEHKSDKLSGIPLGMEQLARDDIGTEEGQGPESWQGQRPTMVSVLRAAHWALLGIVLFSAPAQNH